MAHPRQIREHWWGTPPALRLLRRSWLLAWPHRPSGGWFYRMCMKTPHTKLLCTSPTECGEFDHISRGFSGMCGLQVPPSLATPQLLSQQYSWWTQLGHWREPCVIQEAFPFLLIWFSSWRYWCFDEDTWGLKRWLQKGRRCLGASEEVLLDLGTPPGTSGRMLLGEIGPSAREFPTTLCRQTAPTQQEPHYSGVWGAVDTPHLHRSAWHQTHTIRNPGCVMIFGQVNIQKADPSRNPGLCLLEVFFYQGFKQVWLNLVEQELRHTWFTWHWQSQVGQAGAWPCSQAAGWVLGMVLGSNTALTLFDPFSWWTWAVLRPQIMRHWKKQSPNSKSTAAIIICKDLTQQPVQMRS